MKKLLLLVPVLLILGLPWELRAYARGKGVDVGRASWCGQGVCFDDVTREGDRVEHVEIRWDGSVHLVEAVVGIPTGSGAGEGRGLPFRRVTVDRLTLRGAPVAPLSGEIWPERRLMGEGITVEGERVIARVPTEYGEFEAEVEPTPEGMRITASCDCSGRWEALGTLPVAAKVQVEGSLSRQRFSGRVVVGDIAAEVEAEQTGDTAKGTFRLPVTPIADIYAVFGDLVPEARRARIDGTIEGSGTFDLATQAFTFTPVPSGFSVSGIVPAGYDHGAFRRRVKVGDVEEVRRFGEGAPGWMPLVEMGHVLPMAVIAGEDSRFLAHPGYDVEGMLAAATDNSSRGEMWRGGSTLTQQLAKNLFLDGTRTYARKLRELLYAVELERTLGKMRILELYLNVVELGPGIFGASTASQVYFLKKPAGLLPEEAAWIASILPQPRTAYEQQYLRNRPNRARVDAIIDGMRGLDESLRVAAKVRPIRFVPP